MEPEQKPSFTAAFQAVAAPKDMVGLAYAEGYVNSIHVKGEGYSAAFTQKKETEKDHVSYMAGALIRKYDEVSRAANQALNDLERSLEDNKAWLEEYEQEIENNTITLADGTAVYYNAETGLFEEQQEDGTWRAVDQEAQKEALALVEENGGIAASRQAREFADELNEKHERLDSSIETMRLDITDIDKAVETGALSPDEGAALKEDVLARTEITQAEIDEAVLYREGGPAAAAQVEPPEDILFTQEAPALVSRNTASAFSDPDYQSVLRGPFEAAALGEEQGAVSRDLDEQEPAGPVPGNGGAMAPPRP